MKRRIIFILSLIFIGIFLFSSCEPLATFKIRNDTEETLNIFVSVSYSDHVTLNDPRVSAGTVEPGQTITHKDGGQFYTYLIEAKDLTGRIVYAKEFPVKELIKNKWKVIITTE